MLHDQKYLQSASANVHWRSGFCSLCPEKAVKSTWQQKVTVLHPGFCSAVTMHRSWHTPRYKAVKMAFYTWNSLCLMFSRTITEVSADVVSNCYLSSSSLSSAPKLKFVSLHHLIVMDIFRSIIYHMELVSNEATSVIPNITQQEHQTLPDTTGTTAETKELLPYGNA